MEYNKANSFLFAPIYTTSLYTDRDFNFLFPWGFQGDSYSYKRNFSIPGRKEDGQSTRMSPFLPPGWARTAGSSSLALPCRLQQGRKEPTHALKHV